MNCVRCKDPIDENSNFCNKCGMEQNAEIRPMEEDPSQNKKKGWSTKKVVAVMITSDKAYDNVEWVWGYRESDRLGGKDPYSASKGMAELAIRSYVESFFNTSDSNVRIGITRAGNVIGGGDWAIDRIVPDCMEASANGKTIDIRSPNATRPWQHVLEPLSGYLVLAATLAKSGKYHGEAYNFGPSTDQNMR